MIFEKIKNIYTGANKYLNIIGEFIYKYRFFIAILILVVGVLFEISGSSISCWNSILQTGITGDIDLLYGTPRSIRSDEWAVFIPMIFSQCLNSFNYFSEAIRGDITDVFMIYGLPVMNLMQIFRPFLIGFLFLGISKGLSFFWVSRNIALFLITFDFCMILTKKDKTLSFIGALLVTFSPQIQWWFAVNGTAELFIFGELSLILLYKYMNTQNFKSRLLMLFFMIICAGGYILILYPAWQIPLFYVFLALAIWIIIENRKKCKISKKDIISMILAILIFAGCMGYIFTKSFDTIKAITSTVYPGGRISCGRYGKERFFSYPMNIFLPNKDIDLRTTTSESAVMFGLFPIGIIISIIAMIKNKKVDLPIILLEIIHVFISIYIVFGFPEIISKLTLMGNTVPERAFIAIGFIDILVLIRGITIAEKTPKLWSALIITVIAGSFIAIGAKIENRAYINKIMSLQMCIMISYLFFFCLRYKAKLGKLFLSIGIIVTMFFAGFKVNPIIKGTDIIYDTELIKIIQKVQKEEEGKWITSNIGFPVANYVLMAGVPVINSTNTYPNLERWKLLDSEGKYEEVYNRYAHINIGIVDSEKDYEEKFYLNQPDTFSVMLLPEDLKTLDIKYVATIQMLDKYNTDEIRFQVVGSSAGIIIYKVIYN